MTINPISSPCLLVYWTSFLNTAIWSKESIKLHFCHCLLFLIYYSTTYEFWTLVTNLHMNITHIWNITSNAHMKYHTYLCVISTLIFAYRWRARDSPIIWNVLWTHMGVIEFLQHHHHLFQLSSVFLNRKVVQQLKNVFQYINNLEKNEFINKAD